MGMGFFEYLGMGMGMRFFKYLGKGFGYGYGIF